MKKFSFILFLFFICGILFSAEKLSSDEFKTKSRKAVVIINKNAPTNTDVTIHKVAPTVENPYRLKLKTPELDSLRTSVENYSSTVVGKQLPNPNASDFPGSVSESAPRVIASANIMTQVDGWQCTGIYAPPGEIIRVFVARYGRGSGFQIRIGAHEDDFTSEEMTEWRRFPNIVRYFPVNEDRFEIANPFGGMIYVKPPEPQKKKRIVTSSQSRIPSRVRFEFTGGVEAPIYILQSTNKSDWENFQKSLAPWACFVGKNVMITLPSKKAKMIDNPEPLIKFWDGIVKNLDYLLDIDDRDHREHFIFDVDFKSSFVHGGENIVLPMELVDVFCDLDKARNGEAWGIYFALAQNYIREDWIFDNRRDVAAGLLALYSLEKTSGEKPNRFFDYEYAQSLLAKQTREELIKKEEQKKAAGKKRTQPEMKRYTVKEIPKMKTWTYGERSFKRKGETSEQAAAKRSHEKTAEEKKREAEVAKERDYKNLLKRRYEEHQKSIKTAEENMRHLALYVPIVSNFGWEPVKKAFAMYSSSSRKYDTSTQEKKKETFMLLWSRAMKFNVAEYFSKFGYPYGGGLKTNVERLIGKFNCKIADEPGEKKSDDGYLMKSPFKNILVYSTAYVPPPYGYDPELEAKKEAEEKAAIEASEKVEEIEVEKEESQKIDPGVIGSLNKTKVEIVEGENLNTLNTIEEKESDGESALLPVEEEEE